MIHRTPWWQVETAGWSVEEGKDSTAFVPCDARNEAALVVGSYRKQAAPIGEDDLRELSAKGAPAAAPRKAVRCGDFRGYQAAYDENGLHWRIWWLASGYTHVYATFNCTVSEAGNHDAVLDWILSTLRAASDSV